MSDVKLSPVYECFQVSLRHILSPLESCCRSVSQPTFAKTNLEYLGCFLPHPRKYPALNFGGVEYVTAGSYGLCVANNPARHPCRALDTLESMPISRAPLMACPSWTTLPYNLHECIHTLTDTSGSYYCFSPISVRPCSRNQPPSLPFVNAAEQTPHTHIQDGTPR